MKAIRIREPGGPEVLEIGDAPTPRPGADDVLVRVRVAGINRADVLQRMGRYPAPPGSPPDIPGLEFAGEVVEVGENVSVWKTSDRVMGILGGGGYAEYTAVPAAQLLRAPKEMSWLEAGAIPEVFLTAADALFERGRLLAGETVVVHTAGGGVGTAALQLAREAGAGTVIGTASAPKLDRIRQAGLPLDFGFDRAQIGAEYEPRLLAQAVRQASNGGGADVILDTVGAPYWGANIASLATLGRLVVVGVLGGSVVHADLRALMAKRATVVGTVLRARSIAEKAAVTAEFRRRFLPAFSRAKAEMPLVPVIDRGYPLAEAAEAHRYVESNRSFGKVLLEIE